ncbi:MAG: hypothetical protein KGI80_00875 [Verrucomicrobiota bacterium]|nr:hypothetical protein [Verrucomicrobiota bacterium]
MTFGLSNVNHKDFDIINEWETQSFPAYPDSNIPMYIKEIGANRRYLNQSATVLRGKCFLLALGTPFFHAIAAVVKIAVEVAFIAGFLFGFVSKESAKKAGFALLCDLFFAPATLLGLELAALYGIFMPHDGRKLYATLERFQYNSAVLAPGFQPSPEDAEKYRYNDFFEI